MHAGITPDHTLPSFIFWGVATAAGALAVPGWAPLAWWPFSLLAYAALIWLLHHTRSSLHALGCGCMFGFALHLAGNLWIYSALHHHAGLTGLSALLSTLFFACYVALFTAIPCALAFTIGSRLYPPGHVSYTLLIAALLSLGEWARSLFFNGFTSFSLGYALIDTWLAGYGPILGVYGVSFLGFILSAMLATLCIKASKRRHCGFITLTIAFFSTGWAFSHITWATAAGVPLSYRLIQANIAQELKFDPALLQRQIDRYITQIEAQAADLIITPETAFPVFLNELPPATLTRLQRFSGHTQSHLLLGVATTDFNGRGFNSLLHINPTTPQLASYQKVRLMPFGEYSPSGFQWFTNTLAIPLKDLSAGQDQQPPFLVKHQKIGTLICHEDSNGHDTRRWLLDATLLAMPSNLGWFKNTNFIDHNFQVVRFRAIESARPILRVANTGITAHINPQGRIVQYLEPAKEGILSGRVQPVKGLTPYARAGDFPFLLLTLLALLPGWKLLTHINKLPKIPSH